MLEWLQSCPPKPHPLPVQDPPLSASFPLSAAVNTVRFGCVTQESLSSSIFSSFPSL